VSPALLKVRLERVQALAASLAAETGIPAEDILGRSRERAVVAVRHRLWSALYNTGLSMPIVAELVGVDHTSVLAALRKRRVAA
jgi:chromosomal replication initiation ATPase DnaA